MDAANSPSFYTERSRRVVRQWKAEIDRAAAAQRLSAGVIAAVLGDEINRLDWLDALQDAVGRLALRLPPAAGHWLLRRWEGLARQPLSDQSFGLAQMNLGVLLELARAGRLPPLPADPLLAERAALQRLLAPDNAPYLIAARLRQIVDHWQAQGVTIDDRADVLGTLYSIGLVGQYGVRPNPQPNGRGIQIAAAAREYN